MIHVAAAAGCAALCGAGSFLAPRLIARVPEPEPDPDADADDPVKEPYADIAALPGLAWTSAVAGAVAGALVGGRLGWTWPLLFLVPLVPVLVALAVIDWRTHLLPTRVVWPTTLATAALIVVSWALSGGDEALVRAGWGFVVAYGSFFVLWFIYPKGLGYGDVRLAGVLGLALGYLGWGPLLVGLYAGFLLGGVGGGLLSVLKVVRRKAFPFGPFMVVGALVGVLWGAQILDRLGAG
ncbi:MAG: A24 family peptidase [Actinomycetota bacterium]|nr:A24 family peptidase [Actinomycetota bacterium]